MSASVLYWCCTACHKTGSEADSIEALEVEHALADRCDGRLVEIQAPERAVAVCQQCGKKLEGDIRESTQSGLLHISFRCTCHLTIGKRACAIVLPSTFERYPDRVLRFEPVFGLSAQPELRKPEREYFRVSETGGSLWLK